MVKLLWKKISILLLLPTAFAHAGDTTVGNGGDLVFVNNTYHLLDLFEAGIERRPFFDQSIFVDGEVVERIQKSFPGDPMVQNLLGIKLAEIMAQDLLLGHSLLRTLELLRWQIVSYPLLNVPDEGTPYKGELFQAAIRQGLTVFLQKDLWRSLTAKNRAALVMHELIFALYKPEAFGANQFVQRSYRVREINARLFSEHWQENMNGFYRVLDGGLPTNGKTGFRREAPDIFSVAPAFTVMNAESAVHPVVSKNLSDIPESGKAEFCRRFAETGDARNFTFNLSTIAVRLKRGSFQSPVGILDHVKWTEDNESKGLPPYLVGYFYSWRGMFFHEIFQELEFRPIRKPDGLQEALPACMLYLEENLSKHQHLMNQFR